MGFATLPNQVHRKSVKKGFDFTLMVAGQYVAQDANVTYSCQFIRHIQLMLMQTTGLQLTLTSDTVTFDNFY